MILPDAAARKRILCELGETMCVEAAAGTGKTALIAGRVVMLLGSGVMPKNIAAITFTEAAVGELALRIRSYVSRLRRGDIPDAMALAFENGHVPPDMIANLNAANDMLDDLIVSTIHGFCHAIIADYAIEARLDPGAEMLDRQTAEAMFEDSLGEWLTQHLGESLGPDEPIAVLAKDDPLRIVRNVVSLANLMREHPDATTVSPRFDERPDIELVEAVALFERWYSSNGPEPRTDEIIRDLRRLADFYDGCLSGAPSFRDLFRLAKPSHLPVMVKDLTRLAAYRCKSAWTSRYKDDGVRRNEEALQHFENVDRCYKNLRGQIADALVHRLAEALRGCLDSYASRKEAAAALDFDDLLQLAARLVDNDDVRRRLGARFKHLLVDEFQDTDPLQSKVIFSIAASAPPVPDWAAATLRPGALFLVGDPKQSVFAFRGADIESYRTACRVIERNAPLGIVHITASFRSHPAIARYINGCFETVFAPESGQPQYVPLHSLVEERPLDLPIVSRLTIEPIDTQEEGHRQEEAYAVAKLCARLIGAVEVRRDNGSYTSLVAGDIALLAPTGTELERYERALRAEGLLVSSQAGKGLLQRQETQDVLALLRAFADPSDRMAFIALMRGPLVGLTDEQLLDAEMKVTQRHGERAHFALFSEVQFVPAAVQGLLTTIQQLARRALSMSPAALLAEAIEALNVRAILAVRHQGNGAQAHANLDMIVQGLRRYDVGGLDMAVEHLQRDWERRVSRAEGRVDARDGAVQIVTMHSGKGLEWPVVIPINSSTRLFESGQYLYRRSDNTLHWVLGGVSSPELDVTRRFNEEALRLERQRLWYVAATRARDLLIVPHLPSAHDRSWSRLVFMRQGELPEFPIEKLTRRSPTEGQAAMNQQDAATFAEEAQIITAATPTIRWRRPSEADEDLLSDLPLAANEEVTATAPVGVGSFRGLVMHKLLEEILSGELDDAGTAISSRAATLIGQLASWPEYVDATPPDSGEVAQLCIKALTSPGIAELRSHLVPEISIWSSEGEEFLSGRVDALAMDHGNVDVVVDWKSDWRPSEAIKQKHRTQIADYMHATRARRGAIVYASSGEVMWISP